MKQLLLILLATFLINDVFAQEITQIQNNTNCTLIMREVCYTTEPNCAIVGYGSNYYIIPPGTSSFPALQRNCCKDANGVDKWISCHAAVQFTWDTAECYGSFSDPLSFNFPPDGCFPHGLALPMCPDCQTYQTVVGYVTAHTGSATLFIDPDDIP